MGQVVRLALVSLLLVGLMFAAACRRSTIDAAPEVQVTLATDPAPPLVGPARLRVTITNGDGRPFDGATPVTLRGDMNHAGMVPVIREATGRGEGVYTADFEWTMAGDWTVTVEATLPDGRVKTSVFPFTVATEP